MTWPAMSLKKSKKHVFFILGLIHGLGRSDDLLQSMALIAPYSKGQFIFLLNDLEHGEEKVTKNHKITIFLEITTFTWPTMECGDSYMLQKVFKMTAVKLTIGRLSLISIY